MGVTGKVLLIIVVLAVGLSGLYYTIGLRNAGVGGQRSLIEDVKGARAIAWIAPHPDDEIWASALLGLASLGYGKDVYVVSLSRNATATYPGTWEDRMQDNKDIKEYLGLVDYVYADEYLKNYPGDVEEKFYAFLDDFIEETGVDLIITFENTHGANGHPAHLTVSNWITEYAREHGIKLYYVINRDPILNRAEPGHPLDPLPYTDVLDLDRYYVVKNGANISLWELKLGVIEIYSSSQPGCYYFVTNPNELAKVVHKEWYRRVN